MSAPVSGSGSPWGNASKYTINGKPVVIGFQNDADNLYIYLSPSEKEVQARIARSGMTIWLDSSGKKGKSFGIRYPLGMRGPGMPPRDGGPSRDPRGARPEMSMERPLADFGAIGDTLEIIGPGENERRRAPIENDLGLSVVRYRNTGAERYEYIIPLKASNGTPYAIDSDTGRVISVGFEVAESGKDGMERGPRPGGGMRGGGDGPGGGMPGGDDGFGGPGGAGPGGRGGNGGPRGRGRPSGTSNDEASSGPIKIWVKVKLEGQPVPRGQTALK